MLDNVEWRGLVLGAAWLCEVVHDDSAWYEVLQYSDGEHCRMIKSIVSVG